MHSHWAAENLQVIRTLMERSALYRRALAPVMTTAGSLGVLGALPLLFFKVESAPGFCAYWIAVSGMALICSYLLVRRQALKDAEPFWSPPTRRVTQALLPGFIAGLLLGLGFAVGRDDLFRQVWLLPPLWMMSYGCALHSAGFFMHRGIKLFGLGFVIAGALLLFLEGQDERFRAVEPAHFMMSLFFGGGHLAYGIYLFFTEKGKGEA